jgi:hypothetical protein
MSHSSDPAYLRRCSQACPPEPSPGRVRSFTRRTLALTLLICHALLFTGCTDWFRVPGGPMPAEPPKSAQVWVADSSFVVRSAVVRDDSLLGTVRPVKGDTVGVAVGWRVESIDSVRVRHVSATRSVLAAIGVFAAFGFIVAISGGLYGEES